ncbi:hypothetical protein KP509_12G085400 [Ceratopteris richardii]|uniref:Uncharacterized protein n=1 Tax=Ceratopteris richardii TaxID=49495 RepID=A0A8T2TQF9_CERRI|nr:hypothetical protein KP509_12G085400 [Ceratopteris richardii]
MSTPPWLQAQRSNNLYHHPPPLPPSSQQHDHQHQQKSRPHAFIFRSATPQPARPHSAAAENSLAGVHHALPRSQSVVHSRPPSAPRMISPSLATFPESEHMRVDDEQGSSLGGTAGNGNQINLDISAIQRIADGVERMVRSWTSENSCRAQVYAKAYDSLHAAVGRGKEQGGPSLRLQQNPIQEPIRTQPTSTEAPRFKIKSGQGDEVPHNIMSVHNLQSLADPNSVGNSQNMLNSMIHQGYEANLIDDEEQTSSVGQQVQESNALQFSSQGSYGGHVNSGHDVASLSMCAPYAKSMVISRNQPQMGHGEVFCMEGSHHQINQERMKKLKTGNTCSHNCSHDYPELGLTNSEDSRVPRDSGNLSDVDQYSQNQLDNMQAEYQSMREIARVCQHGRTQQRESIEESAIPSQLQRPQYQESNQLQNTQLVRSDHANSTSLVKSIARSRSAPVRQLGTLSTVDANNTLEVYHEGSKLERMLDEKYEAKVKALEISLLECATEYEVQLVEMKMKMLQMKSEFRQKSAPEESKLALCSRPLQTLNQEFPNNTKLACQLLNAPFDAQVDQAFEPAVLKSKAHKEEYGENASPNKSRTRVDGMQKKSGFEGSGKIVTSLQNEFMMLIDF